MSSVDHPSAMIDRLAQFLRGKTKVENLFQKLGEQVNKEQVAFDELLSERDIASATGEQLDVLGAIVGESRDGLSDSDYRQFILARIQLNTASGTVEDLILIIQRIILPRATYTIHIRELEPCEVQVRYSVSDASSGVTNPEKIGKFLQLAKAAGVRILFIANPSTAPGQFLLTSTDQAAIDGNPGLADTDYDPVGGTLSGIY